MEGVKKLCGEGEGDFLQKICGDITIISLIIYSKIG